MTTSQNLKRSALIDNNAISVDDRTVTLAFSSETPYERHFGNEVLKHGSNNIRFERLENGAALLLDHDWSKQIGVVEKAWLEDGKGRAVVRFSKNPLGDEVFNDVVDGIRKHISVGYSVHDMQENKQSKNFDVTDWEPLEISIVSVPADTSVGVGRKLEQKQSNLNSETKMQNKQEKIKSVEPNLKKMQSIFAIGDMYGEEKAARNFALEGKSEQEFKDYLFEKKMNKKDAGALPDNGAFNVGLSQREAGDFSFQKVIHYLANPNSKSAREKAAFEIEVSQAVSSQGGGNQDGQINIPYDVISRTHSMTGITGDNSNTSSTIKETYKAESFIELLNNRSIALQLATQMNNLSGKITIPKQTKSSEAHWVEEAQEAEETGIGVDSIELRSHGIAVITKLTHDLINNSACNIESIIRQDIAIQTALKIDRAILYGTGKGQPLGLKNLKGIAQYSYHGEMNFADFVELEKIIQSTNADVQSMVFVMNPADLSDTKIKPRGNGIQAPILEPGNTINGFRVESSNQIPRGEIFFGNFSDLIFGTWGGISLTVDNLTLAAKGIVKIITRQHVGSVVRRTESFCIANNSKKKA